MTQRRSVIPAWASAMTRSWHSSRVPKIAEPRQGGRPLEERVAGDPRVRLGLRPADRHRDEGGHAEGVG